MLQPTALTEIFDENFPGWGVKTMRVKVPSAAFTTTTRHAETLQKRGVVDTFCSAEVRENLFGVLRVASNYFLNPIVQTNHVQISKDMFRIASATGATLNSQVDYDKIPRSDHVFGESESTEEDQAVADQEASSGDTGSVEVTTQPSSQDESEASSSSVAPPVVEEESTGRSARSVDGTENDETVGSTEETVTTIPESQDTPQKPEAVDDDDADAETEVSSEIDEEEGPLSDDPTKVIPKGLKRGNAQMESYVFDEPFLWFLHATNEEPMFMGIIESFKRYKEQGANKAISLASADKFAKDGSPVAVTGGAKLPLVDVIADTANINLWNC